MLPFHKRNRSSSVIEIDSADIEPVELPRVLPPTPRVTMRPQITFVRKDDDERTMLMPEKRRSSAPPPPARVETRVPSVRVPPLGALPKFGPSLSMSDEVTLVRPGTRRSLLSMKAVPAANRMSINSMMREELASQLEPSKAASKPLTDVAAPRANASDSVPAMAMSAADSSATVLVRQPNNGRPTAVWAMALLALGLFGGLLTSMVTRNEIAAAPVQAAAPRHNEVAPTNVVAAVQAPIVQQQVPATIADALGTPANTACGVDPAPSPPPNPTTKATAIAMSAPAPVADKADAKPEVKPAAKPAIVAHARPAAPAAPKSDVVVAAVAKPAPKPAVTAPKKALGDDMEQANAADALARAQLEAALNR